MIGFMLTLLLYSPAVEATTTPPKPDVDEQKHFIVNDKTEGRLDGQVCKFEDVPATASVRGDEGGCRGDKGGDRGRGDSESNRTNAIDAVFSADAASVGSRTALSSATSIDPGISDDVVNALVQDVNGDGVPDLITGPGAGNPAQKFQVIDGTKLSQRLANNQIDPADFLFSVFPFGSGFTDGVAV
jgi:hypothetical protein